MVSELATNAVKHARTGFSLVVEERDDGVRIEVTDHGPGTPRKRSPSPQEPSGRGLLIVQALSDDWGIVEEQHGKAVWLSISPSRL